MNKRPVELAMNTYYQQNLPKCGFFYITHFFVPVINFRISITYGLEKIGTFDAEVLCKK
ncbi:MAG: hypothetical protein PVI77_11425 [Desulfobacterales bacterium]|jgi:hypothetical protein